MLSSLMVMHRFPNLLFVLMHFSIRTNCCHTWIIWRSWCPIWHHSWATCFGHCEVSTPETILLSSFLSPLLLPFMRNICLHCTLFEFFTMCIYQNSNFFWGKNMNSPYCEINHLGSNANFSLEYSDVTEVFIWICCNFNLVLMGHLDHEILFT